MVDEVGDQQILWTEFWKRIRVLRSAAHFLETSRPVMQSNVVITKSFLTSHHLQSGSEAIRYRYKGSFIDYTSTISISLFRLGTG